MKRQIVKIISIFMALVCFMNCLVACGDKDVNISDVNSSISIEDIYYDEESGEIIDSSTGNIVKDDNLYVDEDTGDIVDKETGEVVKPKDESDKTQHNSSNNTSSNTSKDEDSSNTTSSKPSNTSPDKNNDKNNTNNSTNNNSSNSTPTTNNNNTNNNANNNNSGSNNSTNNNNQDNSNTDFNITLPTSSKKVSFNRQKLYDEMIAIYEKPEYPELIPIMTKDEFFHQINGTVPPEIQYIVDWYFAVYDKKEPESIICTSDHAIAFNTIKINKVFNVLTYDSKFEEGKIIINTTYDRISTELDKAYSSYSHNPTTENEIAILTYNYDMNKYNENLKYSEEMCDKIADALVKAGVKNGENEVTAINKIIKYISDNCEYSYSGLEFGNGYGCRIQDVFNLKEAVCAGYAKTFWAMCKYCNIDVEYHRGKTSEGQEHAWNSVKINNKDYYFDVTWYDIQLNASIKTSQDIWCTKSEFDKDHIRESSRVYYW